MLTHPMLDQLGQLGLSGMVQAFAELEASEEAATLTHADWLGLLVDRELTHRRDKRLAARLRYARLRYARLRQQASVEDVDYRAPRGLDRALFQKLTNSEWIDAHGNLILCGPTGVGKSWLACALGHKACRDNRSVLYQRVPKLFAELALARGDGRYARILRGLTGVQLLILDDWGLEPLDAGARRDLYEILEERYGRRSTILTSQIPATSSESARLRTQIVVPGQTIESQLEHRIAARRVGVVAILIAGGNHQQAKADDLGHAMHNLLRHPISRNANKPPSEDSWPPSKRATTALPCTGDRPGRNGVASTMAGAAPVDPRVPALNPNPTPDQYLGLHPPALTHNPG